MWPFPPLRSNPTNVLNVLDANEEVGNLVEFAIFGVVDERRAIDGIFGMEYV